MFKSNYREAIRVLKFILILLGIWPRRGSGVAYRAYGYVTTFVLPLAFVFPSFFEVSLDAEHAAESSYYLFCSITVLSYTAKLAMFCLNRDLLESILACLKQPLFNSHEARFDVHMRRAVRISSRVRKLIHYPCVLFTSFIATFPVLDRSKRRPLPFAFPVDAGELPFSMYSCVYVLEVMAAGVCACTNGTLDALVCSLIALGTAQLEILGAKLRNVNGRGRYEERGGDVAGSDEEVVIIEELKGCVEHHTAIIEYVRKIEEMYSYTFLTQFLSSLIAIGIAGFSFIVIPINNILLGAAVSYFVAAMVEVSMYCIFGDELMIQSLKISEACYTSKWNDCSPEARKIIFIMMERSKQPLVLTAKKFSNLSRQSLVTICKTSYSYFTLLRRMYGLQE